MSVFTKLHSIQSQVQSVGKNGVNKFQHYNYVMLNDILDAVRPYLKELGLVVFQSTTTHNSRMEFVEEKTFYTTSEVHIDTTLVDIEDNTQITVGSVGFSSDKNGDKAAFKAETGARKYGLLKLFGLDTNEAEPENDEAPKASPNSTPKQGTGTRGKLF
jgi:hypothetical protein